MVLVATQVKRRRGTNNENDAFAGAEGEITVDLTNKELRVHDGSGKTGGFTIGRHTDRTNCFLEGLHVDIQIDNSGNMTVKSGTQYCVPNGAGSAFLLKELSADKTTAVSAFNDEYFYFVMPNESIYRIAKSRCYGGATAPSGFGNYAVWFDTNTGYIKLTQDGGATWTSGLSCPLCWASSVANTSTTIRAIFDVGGYMGIILYALPFIALIPNGYKNGKINNIIAKNTGFHYSIISGNNGDKQITLTTTGYLSWGSGMAYRPEENKNYNYNTESNQGLVGRFYWSSSGGISNFRLNRLFIALDKSDTEYIAHQAMLNKQHIDLTLGASGTTYTMPADGYIYIYKTGSGAGQWLTVKNQTTDVDMIEYDIGGGSQRTILMPVSKGDIVQVGYSLGGATNKFRFYYANGSK